LYQDVRDPNRPTGSSGGFGFFENNDGKNLQTTLKSTNIFDWQGNHQFRYGVAYQTIDFTRGTNYTGFPVQVADGRTTLTGVPV